MTTIVCMLVVLITVIVDILETCNSWNISIIVTFQDIWSWPCLLFFYGDMWFIDCPYILSEFTFSYPLSNKCTNNHAGTTLYYSTIQCIILCSYFIASTPLTQPPSPTPTSSPPPTQPSPQASSDAGVIAGGVIGGIIGVIIIVLIVIVIAYLIWRKKNSLSKCSYCATIVSN